MILEKQQQVGLRSLKPITRETARTRPQSFSMPGLFRWKEQSEGEWTRVEAVNIESREGNPARVSVSEFEIKLCDAPLLDRKPQNEGDEFAVVGESVVREEYGYGAMILLLGILLLESWYAAHLGARERV